MCNCSVYFWGMNSVKVIRTFSLTLSCIRDKRFLESEQWSTVKAISRYTDLTLHLITYSIEDRSINNNVKTFTKNSDPIYYCVSLMSDPAISDHQDRIILRIRHFSGGLNKKLESLTSQIMLLKNFRLLIQLFKKFTEVHIKVWMLLGNPK